MINIIARVCGSLVQKILHHQDVPDLINSLLASRQHNVLSRHDLQNT